VCLIKSLELLQRQYSQQLSIVQRYGTSAFYTAVR